MEKKELKEKLIKTAKARGFVCEASSGKVKKNLQLTFNQKELLKLISEELDKARAEVEDKFREKYKKREKEMNVPYSAEDGKEFWQGYQEGYHQGLKDMVVDTHYLDEEFQSKLNNK